MYVIVKCAKGTYTMYIIPEETIFQVKERLVEITGIPIEKQRVLTYSKILDDNNLTVDESPIYYGCFLYVS